MDCLLDALSHAFAVLGFDRASGGDEVFRDLVLARIIEPVSKLDSLRVLGEAGVAAASCRALKRRLPVYAKGSWRQKISACCAAHAGLGPASLVLFDVSTLYFETDAGDGFREPGFSKERRLEPQITIGLLADQNGFPLERRGRRLASRRDRVHYRRRSSRSFQALSEHLASGYLCHGRSEEEVSAPDAGHRLRAASAGLRSAHPRRRAP